MGETEGPASSPPPPPYWNCHLYHCGVPGEYHFPYRNPPSTNSISPPPPPPPLASVLPASGSSPASAIVHPLLIAIIPSFAFVLVLGLYYILAARLCPNRGFFFFSGLLSPGSGGRRHRRFRHSPDDGGGQSSFFSWPAHAAVRGLDESLIALIPVCTYAGAEQGLVGGSECAVCLGEFQHGEVLRLLPKCSHAFHLTCIDKWLRTHTTCPMCRANVVNFNFANAAMAMAPAPNPSPPPAPPLPDPTVPNSETTTEPQLHGALVSMKRSFSEGLLLQNPALAMAMVRTNTNTITATAPTTTTIPSKNPPSSSSSHHLHRVLDKSRSFDMSSAKGKHTDTCHPLDNPSMKRPLLGSRVFSDEDPTDISTTTPSSSPSDHIHQINPGESLLGSSKVSDKNTADASSTSNVWHLAPGNASMTKPLLGSRVFSDKDSLSSSSPSDYPHRDLDESPLGSSATSGENTTTDTSTSFSGHGHSSR